MASSIYTPFPGSKRASDSSACRPRRRLDSTEGANSTSSPRSLPVELWTLVASYLPKEDLKNLSEVSMQCKSAALCAKNAFELKSAVKEMHDCARLNPNNPEDSSAFAAAFKEVIADLTYHQTHLAYLTIENELMKDLQSKIQRLATEFFDASYKCYQKINKNTMCFDGLEKIYLLQKQKLFLRALNHVIDATKDPYATRGWTLTRLAVKGSYIFLKAFLVDKPVSVEHRSLALCWAAEKGHLACVKALFKKADIFKDYFDAAISSAVMGGCLETLEFLLENITLSIRSRNAAVLNAARYGDLPILQALLNSGAISDEGRSRSLWFAAGHGHLSIVEALLASGPIHPYFYRLAQGEAMANNRQDILALLK